MANGNSSTVTNVSATETKQPAKDKLTEVTVTIEEGKESAQIVYASTQKVLSIAYSLNTHEYDNESQFMRDALHDGSVLFLKATCQRAIQKWANTITAMEQVQKYQHMTRLQVEAALKIHPKYKGLWEACAKAKQVKDNLK